VDLRPRTRTIGSRSGKDVAHVLQPHRGRDQRARVHRPEANRSIVPTRPGPLRMPTAITSFNASVRVSIMLGRPASPYHPLAWLDELERARQELGSVRGVDDGVEQQRRQVRSGPRTVDAKRAGELERALRAGCAPRRRRPARTTRRAGRWCPDRGPAPGRPAATQPRTPSATRCHRARPTPRPPRPASGSGCSEETGTAIRSARDRTAPDAYLEPVLTRAATRKTPTAATAAEHGVPVVRRPTHAGSTSTADTVPATRGRAASGRRRGLDGDRPSRR
jgi:hypothetical protein